MKYVISVAACLVFALMSTKAFAQDIEVYKSHEIKPDTAKQVQIYKANEIKVHKANTITPEKARDIELHKARTISPDRPGGVTSNQGNELSTERRDAAGSKHAGPAKQNSAANTIPENKAELSSSKFKSAEFYFGVWHTRVPGAVWTTPGSQEGYDKLHVSAGAQAGDLVIYPNGKYKWDSYGGKKGQWIKGNSDYPVILIDNSENKKWKVGFDPKHTGGRDIIIWDGSIWYDGRK